MNILIKFFSDIVVELIKHYAGKIKRTAVDSAGNPEREKRLRDKIRNRWKEK